jgi:peptidoglycan/LPS O-acetylase OafA/YrhL
MSLIAAQHTVEPPRRRAWPWLLLVLIAAQFALLVHQFEHHTHFDVANTTEDCALCSFASGMAAAPPTQSIAAPFFTTSAVLFAALADVVATASLTIGFFARGPPASLSA